MPSDKLSRADVTSGLMDPSRFVLWRAWIHWLTYEEMFWKHATWIDICSSALPFP